MTRAFLQTINASLNKQYIRKEDYIVLHRFYDVSGRLTVWATRMSMSLSNGCGAKRSASSMLSPLLSVGHLQLVPYEHQDISSVRKRIIGG